MTPDDERSVVRRSDIPPSVSQPVVTPLWPSVVYRTDDADELDGLYEGDHPGYSYAREGHPNADVVASKLNWLEGLPADAPRGIITGSGMAALSAVLLGLLSQGDHVVAGDQLYGRTRRLLDDLRRLGVEVTLADLGDSDAAGAAIRPDTKLILAEVVSNPTLRVVELDGLAALAATNEALLVIDNTFTTPRMIKPLARGADIIVHSVTKLLAGHADVTLGYVGTRDAALAETVRASAVTHGHTPSPFDCWLAERGLHTFDLRYDRAEATARRLADELALLGGVRAVTYPGRSDHPDHHRARALFGPRSGNLVTIELDGGRSAVNRFIRAVPNTAFAPTLGDVATTLAHPASSSHRAMTDQQRADLGISEGLLRISVGVEDADQLVPEFCRAVKAAC